MAPKLAVTGLELFPVAGGNFASPMNTTEMARHTPLADFLTFWHGLPLELEEALRDIGSHWRTKGRYHTPTIDSAGTTLGHVMPFLTPTHQSMVHTLLAVHYYRLFGATP